MYNSRTNTAMLCRFLLPARADLGGWGLCAKAPEPKKCGPKYDLATTHWPIIKNIYIQI